MMDIDKLTGAICLAWLMFAVIKAFFAHLEAGKAERELEINLLAAKVAHQQEFTRKALTTPITETKIIFKVAENQVYRKKNRNRPKVHLWLER